MRMDNIRCLIADIPQILLADIVQGITESRSGFDVVKRVENKNNLPQIVREHKIDVVILEIKASRFSNECNEILDSKPELVIVGLVKDGRRAAILIDNIGKKELIKLIRTTHKYKYRNKTIRRLLKYFKNLNVKLIRNQSGGL